MYELILHAQVAASRQNQVLQILAGITAMQPVDLREQCLIYQQLKPTQIVNAKKGAPTQSVTQQRLRYHQLTRDIEDTASPSPWKLVVAETPDAGMKDVNARTISESTLDPANLERFQSGSGWYKFITQYMSEGCRFVHGNVLIRVTRTLGVVNNSVELIPIDAPPPDRSDLELLDKSGSYAVEAYIHTEDGPSQPLREKATDELLKFSRSLEGAIDFRQMNRLMLDTVVKGS